MIIIIMKKGNYSGTEENLISPANSSNVLHICKNLSGDPCNGNFLSVYEKEAALTLI